MENIYINHWAVIVAAISDFAIGALWYSPLMFVKPWMKVNGFTEESMKNQKPAVTFSLALLFSLVISYNLAFFLGDANTDAVWGLTAGLLAGFGFAAMAFIIIGLFEMRSFKYMLINTGYIIVAFALKGFIIGAWR